MHKETGLMVVPCRKADAAIQVLKSKAEEMEALPWCRSMLLFFAQMFETQRMNGSSVWKREDHWVYFVFKNCSQIIQKRIHYLLRTTSRIM